MAFATQVTPAKGPGGRLCWWQTGPKTRQRARHPHPRSLLEKEVPWPERISLERQIARPARLLPGPRPVASERSSCGSTFQGNQHAQPQPSNPPGRRRHSSPNPMPFRGVSVPARTAFSTTLEPGTQIEGVGKSGACGRRCGTGRKHRSSPSCPGWISPWITSWTRPNPGAGPGGNPPPSTARTRGRGEALVAACGG